MSFAAATLLLIISSPLPDAQPFYPLAKGNKWEYKVTIQGKEVEAVQEVTKVTKTQGERDQATLITTIEGNPSAEVLSTDGSGLYRHSYNGVDLGTPLTAIKLPAKVGAKWTEQLKIANIETDVDVEILKEAVVKVDAGEFKAFQVQSVTTLMGKKLVGTVWYTDGVGVVKQEMSFNGVDLKSELKKFTPAK